MKKIRLNNNRFFRNVLTYTGLFAIVVAYILYIFLKYKKGFIWQPDGLEQHIITLKYFRNLLIDFIKTGVFSTFTWNIGNGINLFGNLGYYIFGDLFSYLSILVPTSKVELLYSVLIFVRLYFVGISFLYFCKYKKINTLGSVIGALMYTFCTFAIFSAVRHPYFLNSLIIFPLIMIGIEKILLENKSIFYTIVIALLFVMNFYFAYMISIIIGIYGIILLIYTYKSEGIKKIVKKLLQILFYTLIGLMISAVILLPTAMEFLHSERSGNSEIQPYSINYYRNLVSDLLDVDSVGYWGYWGVQSIILISLPIFIRNRKQNYPMFLLMVVLLIPLLISHVGSAFCGFSYPNNRWTFVFSFLFSFITATFIHNGSKVEKKNLKAILIFVLFYMLANFVFEVEINSILKIQLAIAIIILLLILNKEKIEKKFTKINLYYGLLIFTFIIGILFSIYYMYEIGEDNDNYVSEFVDSGGLNKVIKTSKNTIKDFDKAISYIKKSDNGFYKISKYPYSYENVSMVRDYKSIGSYYSITPHYYKDICMDLQNAQYSVSRGLGEFDYRTRISTLLGVKYYITKEEGSIPYGYTKMEDYDGTSKIYINQYNLPFAVLYDDYITVNEYEKMNPLEKENSLLKTTVLQDDDIKNTKISHNDEVIEQIENHLISEVSYNVIDKCNILKDNKVIVSNEEENYIQIKIDKVKNSELYLYVPNIQYLPYTKKEIINLELGTKYTEVKQKKVEEKYKWYQPNYAYKITVDFGERSHLKSVRDYKTSPYYFKNDEMLFNLGYYDEISGIITLKFSKVGTYDLSSLNILAVSMEEYENDIKELKESDFKISEYGNGYMSGTVNSKRNGVLQFATMYNQGWRVYVDGKEVNTLISNNYFLGINITSGEHTIYMKYTTPYLYIGIIISFIGIGILATTIILKKLIIQK